MITLPLSTFKFNLISDYSEFKSNHWSRSIPVFNNVYPGNEILIYQDNHFNELLFMGDDDYQATMDYMAHGKEIAKMDFGYDMSHVYKLKIPELRKDLGDDEKLKSDLKDDDEFIWVLVRKQTTSLFDYFNTKPTDKSMIYCDLETLTKNVRFIPPRVIFEYIYLQYINRLSFSDEYLKEYNMLSYGVTSLGDVNYTIGKTVFSFKRGPSLIKINPTNMFDFEYEIKITDTEIGREYISDAPLPQTFILGVASYRDALLKKDHVDCSLGEIRDLMGELYFGIKFSDVENKLKLAFKNYINKF